jgi:hypothetical protein
MVEIDIQVQGHIDAKDGDPVVHQRCHNKGCTIEKYQDEGEMITG